MRAEKVGRGRGFYVDVTQVKRWLVLPLVAASIALFPMAAAANEGDKGGQHGQGASHHFGPFNSASDDSGTCGNTWAKDTFKRSFTVDKNSDGSFAVREAFNGHFVTTAGASPGACQTSTPHGLLVKAGVTGHFAGFLSGTVSGGTYNQDGCNTSANCNTTTGFVSAVFGPSATYTCLSGVGSCSFLFGYTAHDQGLIFRHWVNASDDLGGNRGDIATS